MAGQALLEDDEGIVRRAPCELDDGLDAGHRFPDYLLVCGCPMDGVSL
jgi:hypothetical protein